MLLVFDIGNSNIVMGAYDGKKLYRHWRISTDRQKTGDEYGMLINELFRFQGMDMNDIDDIIISSVVPPLVIPISKMCERYFKIKPLLVGPGIKTGIRLVYENPRLLGADRIGHEYLSHIRCDSKFLWALAHQSLFLCFTRFHLTAHKFPQQPSCLIGRALANHKLVLIPDQSCNYFNHQFHLFHHQAGTYISL